MGPRAAPRLALVLLCLALGAPPRAEASARDVVVARSEVRGAGRAGNVFFLPAPGKAGAVAVGAAHAFDRTRLAEASEVTFRPAQGEEALAVSRRYFARPGRPFYAPDAGLRGDFLLFALEAPPRGVELLRASDRLPATGEAVRIVGVTAGPQPREETLPGTVVASTKAEIQVDVDAAADLHGFGGAPVLAEDGTVLGLLHAAWPGGALTHLRVGPIGGVIEAMAEPYEEGLGRLFATLAPPASAANSPSLRRREATGTPYGDLAPDAVAERLDAALAAAGDARAPGSRDGSEVAFETPEPGAVFGDADVAFVAGRALARRTGGGRFDIFLVIDTSLSTSAPSGVDVDGDGELGVASDADPESSDPGDSVLAAEIAAAEKVIAGLDPKRTRVGIVSFAGEPVIRGPADLRRPPVRVAALTREPLTSDYRRVRAALDDLFEQGSRGMTHMAAGIDLATLELLGLAGSVGSADPESTKTILFFTDGQPTLPDLDSELGNVGAVLEASRRARRAGVTIDSFALGAEALDRPIATVEMAELTEGVFTAVRDPGRVVEFVDEVRFARVEAVEVRNATSGVRAHDVRVHADGSWEALVPLEVGKNRIEAVAHFDGGGEAEASLLVHHAPGAAPPVVPAELLEKYNLLLERRLLTVEAERAEAVRRELVVEMERERARAYERAERQRKELELHVAPPGAD